MTVIGLEVKLMRCNPDIANQPYTAFSLWKMVARMHHVIAAATAV